MNGLVSGAAELVGAGLLLAVAGGLAVLLAAAPLLVAALVARTPTPSGEALAPAVAAQDQPSPAGLRERVSASVTDAAAITPLWALLVYLLADPLRHLPPVRAAAAPLAAGLAPALKGLPLDATPAAQGLAATYLAACLLWPLAAAPYHLLFETFLATTPGKAAERLAVVRQGGGRPGFREALLRTALRWTDGFPLGLPALASVALTGQRLGDRLAGAAVITTAPELRRPDRLGALAGRTLNHLNPARTESPAAGRRAREEGVAAVRRDLLRLTRFGWVLFFDVHGPGLPGMDCVAVGPTGVFVVRVLGHAGTISPDPETGDLLLDGRPLEEDYYYEVVNQGRHLNSVIEARRGGLRLYLCFPRARVRTNGSGHYPFIAVPADVLTRALTQGEEKLWPIEAARYADKISTHYRARRYGEGPLLGYGMPTWP